MSFFIRRFREVPTLENLTAIETLAIIDRTPRQPVIGVGTGTMLLVGEFEDGEFNEPTEIFGDSDEAAKFGGFGYTYGDVKYQNPCARRHLSEYWNGNGWLKGQNLRPNRKIICRVDTSVGDMRLSLAAALRSTRAPFDLEPAQTIAVTTDAGGPASSTAIIATTATVTGAPFAASGYVGGEQIGITVDGLPEVIISFNALDQTRAQVATKINQFLGYTCGSDTGAALQLDAIQRGSGSTLTLRDVTDPGGGTTLSAIGHAAGTTTVAGSNVANVDSVTAAEAATLINSAAVGGINGVAVADTVTGEVIVYRTGSTSGTISIAAGAMATAMGFTTGTTITANVGDAFDVAAGTRVRNVGGDEWVLMRTVSWPEGTALAPNDGTQDVEVRPATDDGTSSLAAPTTVTTLVDYPSDRMIEVSNPANLTAALTEAQIDARYVTAFAATLDPRKPSAQATDCLCARNSATIKLTGRQNAIDASENGLYGRHFYARASLGWSSAQAIADAALYRRDRVFYTWPGWKMYVPEIASVGTAGGAGFTADGYVDIGGDGPLCYINCRLNPEENPTQDTGWLTFLTDFDSGMTEVGTETLYKALKTAGICAGRIDNEGKLLYQSEVTTSDIAGRKTQKRRKMADFIQDSAANLLKKYKGKLATDDRIAGVMSELDGFFSRLRAVNDPRSQRIADYVVTYKTGEVEGASASGVEFFACQVQLLNSIDSVVFDTEIGEGVLVIHDGD